MALLTIFVASAASAQVTRVEESRFLSLGGAEQWISIRGDNVQNPVLLFLHGGPGDAQSALATTYAPLERDFVLVQWDQRGGGKTLAHSGLPEQNTSLEQLVQDGVELAEWLRSHLNAPKIILVGHSWGSYLGVHIVKRSPQSFAAFIGTGQVVSWTSMVQRQYEYTKERARMDENQAAARELNELGVPDAGDFEQYLIMRRWLNQYLAPTDAGWIARQDQLISGALSSNDFQAYLRGFRSMTGLSSVVFKMDVASVGFDFAVPFIVIQGSEDHITDSALVSQYFARVNAPFKRMISIADAGHFAQVTHMPQFLSAIKETLAASAVH